MDTIILAIAIAAALFLFSAFMLVLFLKICSVRAQLEAKELMKELKHEQ